MEHLAKPEAQRVGEEPTDIGAENADDKIGDQPVFAAGDLFRDPPRKDADQQRAEKAHAAAEIHQMLRIHRSSPRALRAGGYGRPAQSSSEMLVVFQRKIGGITPVRDQSRHWPWLALSAGGLVCTSPMPRSNRALPIPRPDPILPLNPAPAIRPRSPPAFRASCRRFSAKGYCRLK